MIRLFHSPLCPRCRAVKNQLRALLGDELENHLECIDVFRQPIEAWHHKVRFIPTLVGSGGRISGLFLKKNEIEAFLRKHGTLPKREREEP